MKIVKLFLPGRFEDAYIYMGKLLLLTEHRTLLVYHLKRLLNNLENRYPDLAPIITMMFGNNNWQQEHLFHSLLENRKITSSIMRTFDRFPQPYLEINNLNTKNTLQAEEEVDISDNDFLDMLVYNRRVYIGTTAGLYHLDVDWKDNRSKFIHRKPFKRLDARCLSTSARFGTVNVSCGHEGLFTALDEFGWLRRGENGGSKLEKQGVAESWQTSWTDCNFVNYSSYENPLFLGNSYAKLKTPSGREREQRVITSIGEKQYQLGELLDQIKGKYHLHQSTVQYSYNTNNTFFVHTYDGLFYSAQVVFPLDRAPEVRHGKTQKGTGTRIVSAHALASGVAIETFNQVWYFNEQWFLLEEAEAISIRTFPRSARYENIVAMTQEDGVLLISVFDDEHKVYDNQWESDKFEDREEVEMTI